MARDLKVLDPVLRIRNMNTLLSGQRHSRSNFMTRSCYALSQPALSRAAGT
jgi:hypothetical protein